MIREYRQIWRFYVSKKNSNDYYKVGETIELSEEESRLATSVLRLREGELVELADGLGWTARCRIESVRKKNVDVIVESQSFCEKKIIKRVAIVGFPKPGAFDEVVQICVDAGIDTLIFFRGDKSTSKQEYKSEKVRKQVIELTRISKSPWLLEVEFCEDLTAAFRRCSNVCVHQRFAYFVCDERQVHGSEQSMSTHLLNALGKFSGISWVAVVGPEGSFSAAEYEIMQDFENQNKLTFVELGPRILRTPAAVSAAVWLMAGLAESGV